MTEKTPPIVIGIAGKARAGKDTVALMINQIVGEYNDSCEEIPQCYITAIETFAAPIKSMVAMLLDFLGYGQIMDPASLQPYIDGDKKEEVLPELHVTPRTLMQTLGTDWGRKLISDTIWLDSLSWRLDQYAMAGEHGYRGAVITVPDVRFDNEAEVLLKKHDAVIVQVVRDDNPEINGEKEHESEVGVSPHWIERTIKNHGTLEDLEAEVRAVLEPILPTPVSAELAEFFEALDELDREEAEDEPDKE
jgi:hypothetical protein